MIMDMHGKKIHIDWYKVKSAMKMSTSISKLNCTSFLRGWTNEEIHKMTLNSTYEFEEGCDRY